MRVIAIMAALLICSCRASEPAKSPPDLHGHMTAARTQITTINAPDAAVSGSVATVLAAKSLHVVSSNVEPSWGRVAAVDSHGFNYVLSWERATASSDGVAEPECVLLFLSCDPGAGDVGLGDLADAVRSAAESAG